MKLRLATFNAENLFARYDFRKNESPLDDGGFTINQLAFRVYNEDEKRLTAQAIREMDADIVVLQEVENLPVLQRFVSTRLAREGYRHRIVVDGNDPRFIDVAILSRHPISSMRTHRHERNEKNSAFLFARDNLRADFTIPLPGGKTGSLTVYANHLKSMIPSRKDTRARRKEQADRIAEILVEDWGETLSGNVIVTGDLNDYPDRDQGTTTALGALLDNPDLIDVAKVLPKVERWTHHYAKENDYKQLDYILMSKSLYERAEKPEPGRVLSGLPYRADHYMGPRFADVGEDRPKASDHVPLYVDIPLEALETSGD